MDAQFQQAPQDRGQGRVGAVGIPPGAKQGDDGRLAVQLGLPEDKSKDGDVQVHRRHPQDPQRSSRVGLEKILQQLRGMILLADDVPGLLGQGQRFEDFHRQAEKFCQGNPQAPQDLRVHGAQGH